MIEHIPQPSKNQEDADRVQFIIRHAKEILPILNDQNERSLVEHAARGMPFGENDREQLIDILERCETKLYTYEKSEYAPDAKRILVTSDNPGSFAGARHLIAAFLKDVRCKGVSTLVSGVAGKDFSQTFPEFEQVREQETLLADTLVLSKEEPFDVVIGTISVENGPENLALYGGKSNLRANKTFLLFEAYGSLGGAFGLGTSDNMDKIDGIFCNDELAKEIVQHFLPEYPAEKIFTTGTPVLEGLEVERAKQYRTDVRAELGISPDAFTIAYLGDNSNDYARMPNANPDINAVTFAKTLKGIKEFAARTGSKETALIVRPHPRDPAKRVLLNCTDEQLQNLAIVNGSMPAALNGILYASDVVVSIMSSENFLAPARGRYSIFLAYDGAGLGGEALRSGYGEEIFRKLKEMPNMFIVSTESELTELLLNLSRESLPNATDPSSGTKNIVAQVLS
ncbi:MAG: hypothetical protein Q8O19_04260 [Rectinemataceae bacterium]|nr:hypothetical protein [Rectinemataceae bacterium]